MAFHIMAYWYNEHISAGLGTRPRPGSWHMSAWQWKNFYGERPIEDTLSALIFDNLFGRFPDFTCWWPSTAPNGCPISSATWTRAAGWAATGRGSAAS